MASQLVTLSTVNERIRLVSRQPLDWRSRAYLVNVLEFEQGDSPMDYWLDAPGKVPRKLEECVEYLRETHIEHQLDSGAQAALDDVKAQHQLLGHAKVVGKELKDHPVETFTPPGFVRTLKPYQSPAAAHLTAVEGAANFSVPGSGKTTVVLAAFAQLRAESKVATLVVVGPRSCFMPWEDEFAACFGKRPTVTRITGARADRAGLFAEAEQSELVLLSYHMASNDRDALEKLLRHTKAMLVIDESHNIKRISGGKWADAILSVAPLARRRVALSGTPLPNALQDLWSQITFLWPWDPPLGEREQFKYQAAKDPAATEKRAQAELYPLYWRTHKHDLKLPKPRFHTVRVSLNKYQSAIYRAIAAKVLAEVTDAPEERANLRVWRKAKMVRLLQAASNPSLLKEYSPEFRIPPLEASGLSVDRLIDDYSQYEAPKKLVTAAKLVRKLVARDEKVVLWTSFIHNITTLESMLKDLNPKSIHGAVPKDENEDEAFNRETIIRDFKTKAESRILIANPAACAESISLHKVCRHAIYLDRTFNGAHYMQSLDRIHRVGLEKGDQVHYWLILATNSIDEAIHKRLTEKHKRMLELLNDEFAILDLDAEEDDFTEESDEDQDFAALIKELRKEVGDQG